MKKQITALLLMASLLASFTACGDVSDNGDDTADTAVDTVNAEPADGLPKDLNFGDKTVNILNMEYIVSGPPEYNSESGVAEHQADVVAKANYSRRGDIEDRLNVQINFIEESNFNNIPGRVRQSVNAGSDDYDMVFTVAAQQVDLVQEGLYTPVSKLTYVDLDKPWWNKEYIESVSINANNPYILFGDITYNSVQRTCAVLFNKNLLEERLNMTDADIYSLVLDGKWTIEKMTELASAVYADDGNQKNDYDDIHGIIALDSHTFEWMAYSAGIEFTARDEEGYPKLNLNTEGAVDLVDKLLALFGGEHVYKAVENGDQVQKFADGKALFLVNRLYLCDWPHIREMEDDYGIIPLPKYDENIDGYHATVEALVQWGAVPITADELDMVSAVAEALAYEGYDKVTPAYYETALKLQYTRGEDVDIESQIIDLITEGARTDFLFLNRLGGLGDIFSHIAAAGQNDFASYYASKQLAAKGYLNEIIENGLGS